MDRDWWNEPRPHFSDRTEYPSAQDVLDALWMLQDLALEADRAGSWANAERLRLVAEEARIEYRRRSCDAFRTLLPQLRPEEHPWLEPQSRPDIVPPPLPGAGEQQPPRR